MTDYSEILGDVSKEKYRQVMNRLLNECYILKRPKETASEYRFIKENAEMFEGMLDLLGYELIIRDDQGVITINNPAGTGRVHLSKLESILLLILRLLYIEKMKELCNIELSIDDDEDTIYAKFEALLRTIQSFCFKVEAEKRNRDKINSYKYNDDSKSSSK